MPLKLFERFKRNFFRFREKKAVAAVVAVRELPAAKGGRAIPFSVPKRRGFRDDCPARPAPEHKRLCRYARRFLLKNLDWKAVFDEPRKGFAWAEIKFVNRFFFTRGAFDLLFRLRFARAGDGNDDGFLFAVCVFNFSN